VLLLLKNWNGWHLSMSMLILRYSITIIKWDHLCNNQDVLMELLIYQIRSNQDNNNLYNNQEDKLQQLHQKPNNQLLNPNRKLLDQ
jgi:hypothetical protein